MIMFYPVVQGRPRVETREHSAYHTCPPVTMAHGLLSSGVGYLICAVHDSACLFPTMTSFKFCQHICHNVHSFPALTCPYNFCSSRPYFKVQPS